MAVVGNLLITASARTDAATKKLGRMGSVIQNVQSRVLGLAAAWVSFAGVVRAGRGISEALDRIDRFAKKSVQLNLPVAELQAFDLAAQLAGQDFEVVAKGLSIMQRQIGSAAKDGGELAESLQLVIGSLSIAEFSALGASEQFRIISDSLANMENVAVRAKLANDLFGRSGGELLPFILQGSKALEASNKQLERYNLLIGQTDATSVEAANDAWTRMRTVMKGVFDLLAIKLAPLIGAVAELMIVKWGQARDVVQSLATFLGTAAGKTLIFVAATASLAVIIPAVVRLFGLLVVGYRALIGAQSIFLALSGPKGWAVLAGAAIAAAGAIAVANSAIDSFNKDLEDALAKSEQFSDEINEFKFDPIKGLEDLELETEFNKIAENIESRADAMKQALRTPLEEFRDQLIEIEALSEKLGPDFTRRAQLAARDTFQQSLGTTDKVPQQVQVIVANTEGRAKGSQADLARLFKVKIEDQTDVQDEILDEEKQANATLTDILLELRKPKPVTPANLG